MIHDKRRARAGEGHDEAEDLEPDRFRRCQSAEEQASENRADDAKTEIPEKAIARPDDELAAEEASNQPGDDPRFD